MRLKVVVGKYQGVAGCWSRPLIRSLRTSAALWAVVFLGLLLLQQGAGKVGLNVSVLQYRALFNRLNISSISQNGPCAYLSQLCWNNTLSLPASQGDSDNANSMPKSTPSGTRAEASTTTRNLMNQLTPEEQLAKVYSQRDAIVTELRPLQERTRKLEFGHKIFESGASFLREKLGLDVRKVSTTSGDKGATCRNSMELVHRRYPPTPLPENPMILVVLPFASRMIDQVKKALERMALFPPCNLEANKGQPIADFIFFTNKNDTIQQLRGIGWHHPCFRRVEYLLTELPADMDNHDYGPSFQFYELLLGDGSLLYNGSTNGSLPYGTDNGALPITGDELLAEYDRELKGQPNRLQRGTRPPFIAHQDAAKVNSTGNRTHPVNTTFPFPFHHPLIHKDNTHMLILEQDVWPVRRFWLDAVRTEATENNFWIRGSRDRLRLTATDNINGNSVYRLQDANFMAFLLTLKTFYRMGLFKAQKFHSYDTGLDWLLCREPETPYRHYSELMEKVVSMIQVTELTLNVPYEAFFTEYIPPETALIHAKNGPADMAKYQELALV